MQSDLWQTPDYFKELILAEYGPTFDPCPCNPQFDGLTIEWGARNFVNPPFSNIEPWVRKALVEREHGRESVLLLPVRTSVKYFRKLIIPNASKLRFLGSRVAFVSPYNASATSGAPFDCYLVEFMNTHARNPASSACVGSLRA